MSQQDVSLRELSDPVLCQAGDRTILLTRPPCVTFRQAERRHRRCHTSTVLDAKVDAGSAPPAAVRQAVPTPTRRSERHASHVASPDVRPFAATGQPRCQHRRQSDFRRVTEAVSAAVLALLFGDILPFMFSHSWGNIPYQILRGHRSIIGSPQNVLDFTYIALFLNTGDRKSTVAENLG